MFALALHIFIYIFYIYVDIFLTAWYFTPNYFINKEFSKNKNILLDNHTIIILKKIRNNSLISSII